jgi:copper chaperone NosL
MRRAVLALALLAPLALSACKQEQATIPTPRVMTAEAIGRYCGMNLFEHPGPKGQIFAASLIEPVWFSSVRDTITFTMMPDEPKDILAIYVSDMGKAPSWEKPGADNWIEARKALFVIGSRIKGGMGSDELVPFAERAAADRFAGENGGRIVTFDQLSRDDVLAPGGARGDAILDDEAGGKHDSDDLEKRQGAQR